MKEHVPVVTGAKGESLDVIRAAAVNTALYALDKHFMYKKKNEQLMWYRGIRMTYDDLSVALRGDHQLFNAALALCAMEILSPAGFPVKEYAVRKGLASVQWPARLELVRKPGKPRSSSTARTTPTGWHTRLVPEKPLCEQEEEYSSSG